MKEAEIKSVGQLLEEVKKLSNPEGWIFRGVGDNRHSLIPSVGRIRHKSKSSKLVTSNEEKLALQHFKAQVRPYIGLHVENDLEWLIIAQHHGLPTRLLDWTSSPIVAAFFAVKSIHQEYNLLDGSLTNIDGAIYAVKKPPLVKLKEFNTPLAIEDTKLINPPHLSERIPRQVSLLTIHNSPNTAWTPPELVKFLVPRKLKLSVKFELDRLGINQASLFPGIEATAKYLGWQLKWNRLQKL